MKCIRCGRAINAATVSIPATTGRPMVFGPKCARKAGLIEPRRRESALPRSMRLSQMADPRQMGLEGFAC